MRVAVFNGPGRPITIEQVDIPQPGPQDVLVKIGRCGICGSDISMSQEGTFTYPTGMPLGHEYSGEVVEVGSEVTGVKVGDRVACNPNASCGTCDQCREGMFFMCASVVPAFGGFGEFVALPGRNVVVLPQSLSLADGALVEPLACGIHALRLAGMRGGERIVVLGAGSMAVSIIYWGRVFGAGKIVVVSRSSHRDEMVMAMGADHVHRFDDEDPESLIRKLGGPPDIVAECVGKDGMIQKAVELVRQRGTVLSMGMCNHADPVQPVICAFKEVRLLFPVTYTIGEFEETVDVFEKGHVTPELMVSDVVSLEDFPKTFENLRAGAKSLKVHVDPNLEHVHD